MRRTVLWTLEAGMVLKFPDLHQNRPGIFFVPHRSFFPGKHHPIPTIVRSDDQSMVIEDAFDPGDIGSIAPSTKIDYQASTQTSAQP